VALLIAPGAIAFLLTRTMGAMLLTAVAIAVGAAVSGVYLSFFIDSAPGPTIVVLLSVLFVAVFVHSNRRERRRAAQL
jgi:manganese/iron transport system permease protein